MFRCISYIQEKLSILNFLNDCRGSAGEVHPDAVVFRFVALVVDPSETAEAEVIG